MRFARLRSAPVRGSPLEVRPGEVAPGEVRPVRFAVRFALVTAPPEVHLREVRPRVSPIWVRSTQVRHPRVRLRRFRLCEVCPVRSAFLSAALLQVRLVEVREAQGPPC